MLVLRVNLHNALHPAPPAALCGALVLQRGKQSKHSLPAPQLHPCAHLPCTAQHYCAAGAAPRCLPLPPAPKERSGPGAAPPQPHHPQVSVSQCTPRSPSVSSPVCLPQGSSWSVGQARRRLSDATAGRFIQCAPAPTHYCASVCMPLDVGWSVGRVQRCQSNSCAEQRGCGADSKGGNACPSIPASMPFRAAPCWAWSAD
mmetsp:Transcript_2352/g.6031  ORF Transcript_2352/g.6031 Transcript_2352/m.6031 type:complete len:201 (+) Transcript_2352:911-1513(+)